MAVWKINAITSSCGNQPTSGWVCNSLANHFWLERDYTEETAQLTQRKTSCIQTSEVQLRLTAVTAGWVGESLQVNRQIAITLQSIWISLHWWAQLVSSVSLCSRELDSIGSQLIVLLLYSYVKARIPSADVILRLNCCAAGTTLPFAKVFLDFCVKSMRFGWALNENS